MPEPQTREIGRPATGSPWHADGTECIYENLWPPLADQPCMVCGHTYRERSAIDWTGAKT